MSRPTPELAAMQKGFQQLTDMMARQGDQLDQVLAMLRRREAELKRVRAENRRLRKLLGLPPEPDPDGAMLPDPGTAEHTRPIAESFRAWLTSTSLTPSDPVLTVARYYLKHFKSLTLFIDDGRLPIDNNEAEREFQRHAKLRHASLFAGSVEGARRWAILLDVVRTAQKCGVDVESYLTWVFDVGRRAHADGLPGPDERGTGDGVVSRGNVT
jgi:hypothetical protein